jgi:hypothetical protein
MDLLESLYCSFYLAIANKKRQFHTGVWESQRTSCFSYLLTCKFLHFAYNGIAWMATSLSKQDNTAHEGWMSVSHKLDSLLLKYRMQPHTQTVFIGYFLWICLSGGATTVCSGCGKSHHLITMEQWSVMTHVFEHYFKLHAETVRN